LGCVTILNKQNAIFFFYKIGEQVGWGRAGTSGKRKKVGKGVGGGLWCTYCVHMYVNGKMRPVETVPGMEHRR
jgi:hypothetical protein